MLFALEFDEEVSARSYLKELLKCYPYDIEETMVLSLLTKNPFPYRPLLIFLQYFSAIGKIHIITKPDVPSPSLQPVSYTHLEVYKRQKQSNAFKAWALRF